MFNATLNFSVLNIGSALWKNDVQTKNFVAVDICKFSLAARVRLSWSGNNRIIEWENSLEGRQDVAICFIGCLILCFFVCLDVSLCVSYFALVSLFVLLYLLKCLCVLVTLLGCLFLFFSICLYVCLCLFYFASMYTQLVEIDAGHDGRLAWLPIKLSSTPVITHGHLFMLWL